MTQRIGFLRFVIAVAALLQNSAPVWSGEDTNTTNEFKIFSDGDVLLVPVEIEGKTYSFMVDTACGKTIVDTALLKTTPKGTERLMTATDTVSVESFPAPHGRIGSHRLEGELESVISLDFSAIRQNIGHEIYGAIGMDFLGKYVMQIDFDSGTLELLIETPNDANLKSIPLTVTPHGCPCVTGRVERWGDLELMLDTGFVSFATGHLETRICDYGQRLGTLEAIGGQTFVGAAGAGESRVFQTKSFILAGHRIASPIFFESNGNRLGLNFLSQFNICLDFPNKKMYLSQSKSFGKPDGRNRSGMGILWKGGTMVAGTINEDSPAKNAGLHEGDVLLSIGKLDATKSRLFELSRELAGCNASLEVKAIHDGKQFKTTLDLK